LKAKISLRGHNSPALDTVTGYFNIVHIIIPHFFKNKCGFTLLSTSTTQMWNSPLSVSQSLASHTSKLIIQITLD